MEASLAPLNALASPQAYVVQRVVDAEGDANSPES